MNKHNVVFVRLLAFVLAAVMVGGLLPVIAVSADGEGGGQNITKTAVFFDTTLYSEQPGGCSPNADDPDEGNGLAWYAHGGGYGYNDYWLFMANDSTYNNADTAFICLRMEPDYRVTVEQSRYLHLEFDMACDYDPGIASPQSANVTFELADAMGVRIGNYATTVALRNASSHATADIDFGAACSGVTTKVAMIKVMPDLSTSNFRAIRFYKAYTYTKSGEEPVIPPVDPPVDPPEPGIEFETNNFLDHVGGMYVNPTYSEPTCNVGWYYQADDGSDQHNRVEDRFICHYNIDGYKPYTYQGGVIMYPHGTSSADNPERIDTDRVYSLTITYTLGSTNPSVGDGSSQQPLGVLVEVLSKIDRWTPKDDERDNRAISSVWINGEAGRHSITITHDELLGAIEGEVIEGLMIHPYQALTTYGYIKFDELYLTLYKEGEVPTETESQSQTEKEEPEEPEEPPVYNFEEVHVYEAAGKGVTLTRDELLVPFRRAVTTIDDDEAYRLVVTRCGADGSPSGANRYTTNNWESDITYRNTSGTAMTDVFYYAVTGLDDGQKLNEVLKVTVYSVKPNDSTIVLDYGLPIDLTNSFRDTFTGLPANIECIEEGLKGTPTSAYGTFNFTGTFVKYTPNKFMSGADSFVYQYTLLERTARVEPVKADGHQCCDAVWVDVENGTSLYSNVQQNETRVLYGASVQYLFKGWYGNTAHGAIVSFGYQIANGEPVFNSGFTSATCEDAVRWEAYGGPYAERYLITVPVSGLSDGTYPVKLLAKHADGVITYFGSFENLSMRVGTGTGTGTIEEGPLVYTGDPADFKYVGVVVEETVKVVPANVVYYEDTFADIHYNGNGWAALSVLNPSLEQSANQLDPYGYDICYAIDQALPYDKEGYASGGTIHKLELTATSPNVLSFEFTGTGFDLISRATVNKCAVLSVKVTRQSDGEVVKSIPIMAESPSVDFYQIPLIRCHDLDRDTYTVSVMMGATPFQSRVLYVDGIRIYGSLDKADEVAYYNAGEANAEFLPVRDLVLEGMAAAVSVSDDDSQLVAGSFIYFKSDEAQPLENGTIANYIQTGPRGELYINPATSTSAIAFYLKPLADYEGQRLLQIGAHRKMTDGYDAENGYVCMVCAGNVTTFMDDDDEDHYQLICTGTEMYYNITLGEMDEDGRYLVIIGSPLGYTENFSEFLSLTNLKIAGYEIEPLELETSMKLNRALSAYLRPADEIVSPAPLVDGKPCWEKVIGSKRVALHSDGQWIMSRMNAAVFTNPDNTYARPVSTRYMTVLRHHAVNTMWNARPQPYFAVNS